MCKDVSVNILFKVSYVKEVLRDPKWVWSSYTMSKLLKQREGQGL